MFRWHASGAGLAYSDESNEAGHYDYLRCIQTNSDVDCFLGASIPNASVKSVSLRLRLPLPRSSDPSASVPVGAVLDGCSNNDGEAGGGGCFGEITSVSSKLGGGGGEGDRGRSVARA